MRRGEYCRGCLEYDNKKHCCHRWSQVIRRTIEEMEKDAISRASVRMAKYPTVNSDYRQGWNDAIDSIVENEPSVIPKEPQEPLEPAELTALDQKITSIYGAIEINEYVARENVSEQIREAIEKKNQERQQLLRWLEDYKHLRGGK